DGGTSRAESRPAVDLEVVEPIADVDDDMRPPVPRVVEERGHVVLAHLDPVGRVGQTADGIEWHHAGRTFRPGSERLDQRAARVGQGIERREEVWVEAE